MQLAESKSMDKIEKRTIKKITTRLIYFIWLLTIIAVFDRSNIGVAALTMNEELGFSNAVYGMGAGLFFIGYFFFDIPSNLFLVHFGARLWIARIMISWGIISSLTAFVYDKNTFYLLRFLLGAAEAGFYPGIIFYLSNWFPLRHQGKAFSLFMIGSSFAIALLAPVSTLLLSITWFGLSGWQWMFILEGIPAVIFGIVTIYYLPDHPKQATWLSSEEQEWLEQKLAAEKRIKEARHQFSILEALMNKQLLLLVLFAFFLLAAINTFSLWLPLIIKSTWSIPHFQIGLMVSLPFITGSLLSVLYGMHSDYTNDRKWHLAFASAMSSVCLAITIFLHPWPLLYFSFLSLSLIFLCCALAIFWTKPASFLTGTAAAVSFALISSFANLSGFIAPVLMGHLKDLTQSFNSGLWLLSGCLLLASFVIACTREYKIQS